jgi:hypothetical protein
MKIDRWAAAALLCLALGACGKSQADKAAQ